MRILFILENLEIGGVEKVTLQLIKGLLQYKDLSINCLVEEYKGVMLDEYKKFVRIDCFDKKLVNFKNYLREYNPDIIIATKGGLCRYPIINKLFSKRNYKVVVIQHVPINLPEKSFFQNFIRVLSAKILYSKLDHIITVSNGIKGNLIKKLSIDSEMISTIYNPVLNEEINTLANESIDYKKNDYYVCVGRLHFQKGYDLLISIVNHIKLNYNLNLKVLIIGNGPDYNKLAKIVKENKLSDNVIFLGMNNNPYKYIKNAKAILLTSRWEGLPTVLVESAFLKTQMVAFDCRYGSNEITNNGKNGYLIPNGDINEFAKGIISIEQGIYLPSPNVDDFGIDNSIKHYVKLFDKILERRG